MAIVARIHVVIISIRYPTVKLAVIFAWLSMQDCKSPIDPLRYVLGIDAGCASIGWSVVTLDDKDRPAGLYAAGVRRFEAGVEGDISRGRDESKSAQRRLARGPRRNTMRRQRRMRKIFRLLQRAGLLPDSPDDGHDARHALFLQLDKHLAEEFGLRDDRVRSHVAPYHLRALALDQPLPNHALGRALYHLAQRRGFKSNLKAERGDDERGKVKQGISDLEHAIDRAEARTLGEYFAGLDPEEVRIRQRWTSRWMYREEFNEIWQTQQPHHEALNEELRERLEEAIFFQRPLKSQKGLVGKCGLEPYKRRAPIACLVYQRFRLLQRINDLELHLPDGEVRPLTAEERGAATARLMADGDVTWNQLLKTIGVDKSKEKTYGRKHEFNFQQAGDKKMIGGRTASKFASALGEAWDDLPLEDQALLVDEVLSFDEPGHLIEHLQQRWRLTETQAERVADLALEDGYGSVSRRAARKLTEAMGDGTRYAEVRKTLYPNSFQAEAPEERLPPLNEFASSLRNPTVARALSELRKVVNALIDRHGKPQAVRVELARDLKRSRKDRQRETDKRDKNTKSRDIARRRILEERGERYATPHNILKVRLAEECGWVCPFTGRGIEMETLVSDEPQFDVEHIVPYSQSLDNSYVNKTLCLHDENRHVKKNQTPFKAYGSTPKWEEVLQRVKHFRGDPQTVKAKLRRFQTEEPLSGDEFANRQLSDTRYLSRMTADYLATLFGGRSDSGGKLRVQVSPGRLTAQLRRAWGLNQLGLGDPDSADEKDRADHRHHAIDAFVVAVSSPAVVKAASEAASVAESYYARDLLADMQPPWEGFSWGEVGDVIDRITVSSRVERKLNGRLHQDTVLSKPHEAPDPKKPGATKTYHHVRKPLAKMSRSEIEAIVDPTIRLAVKTKLEAIGGAPDKAFADAGNHPYLTAKDGRLIPIHSARIRKADKTIAVGKKSRLRRVAPGENHHMEIVAVLGPNGEHKKWEGHIVSRFEAMRRFAEAKAAGHPPEIICRDHGKDREFVFSLAGGEHVAIPGDGEGVERVYRVTVISGQQIEFVEHHDARPITVRKTIPGARARYSIDKLRKDGAIKVEVSPLGEKRPAGD